MNSKQFIIDILIKDIFGTKTAAAAEFGVTKQYIDAWIKTGAVPVPYASYLSRKYDIPVWLFNYDAYALLSPISEKEYVASIRKHLSRMSAELVLTYSLPNREKVLKENDKKWTLTKR